MLGYFTKYGDGGVDLLPIGRLLKSEVRALAARARRARAHHREGSDAGLWMGQTDEEEMGFTYDALEQYLEHGAGAVSAGRRAAYRTAAAHVGAQAQPAADATGVTRSGPAESTFERPRGQVRSFHQAHRV